MSWCESSHFHFLVIRSKISREEREKELFISFFCLNDTCIPDFCSLYVISQPLCYFYPCEELNHYKQDKLYYCYYYNLKLQPLVRHKKKQIDLARVTYIKIYSAFFSKAKAKHKQIISSQLPQKGGKKTRLLL